MSVNVDQDQHNWVQGVMENFISQGLVSVRDLGEGKEFTPGLRDVVLCINVDLPRFDVHHGEAQLLHSLSYQPLLDLHQSWKDSFVYF